MDTDLHNPQSRKHGHDSEMVLNTIQDDKVSKATQENMEVFWEEPTDQDPENPMNWGPTRKWVIIAMISIVTFLTYDKKRSAYL
jgi:hypothetical protein